MQGGLTAAGAVRHILPMTEPEVQAGTLAPKFDVLRAAHLRAVVTEWVRKRPARMLPNVLLVLGLLLLSGYPWWRTAAVAATFSAVLLFTLFEVRMATRRVLNTRQLFAAQVAALLGQSSLVVLTGGLSSPLWPTVIGHVGAGFAVFGRGREGGVALALTLVLIVAMVLVPAEWFGPPIAEPHRSILFAWAFVHAIILLRAGSYNVNDAYRRAGLAIDELKEEILATQTERASRLESLSAKVAHELKNPLSAVKGLLGLVAKSPLEDKSRERVEVMQKEVARMEAILRDYLTFSRPLDELRPQPVELGVLVDDVLAVLEARAANAGVQLSRAPTTWTIIGDPRRLKEALLNLVGNAVESTPRGGSVVVRVRSDDNGGARIEIEDTGKGISEADLARVGTPFFTTRDGGTGLGVVLARGVVVQHGGTLEYASEIGRGTKVTVMLPFRPSDVSA